ncbi:MAG TPA: hypothetical protein VMW54_06155 [Terriglobia bacterium]|nr:hypothetical protein [Terriglobia bacterium]
MEERQGLRANQYSAYRRTRRASRSLIFAPVTLIALVLVCLGNAGVARASTISSAKTGIAVHLNKTSGQYQIVSQDPAWSFGGSLGSGASSVRKATGHDRVGAYREIAFTWRSGELPLRGIIRLYQNQRLLLFRYTYLKPASPPAVAFPSFTQIPGHLDHFSYEDRAFSPPQFVLGQYGTPWLFFDPSDNAMVISPASHFIISVMRGDGDHLISTGLDKELSSVPAGFTQQTLMAIGPGIRHTWDLWGKGLISLAGRKRPGNESDPTLKYYGYWTDHGASYYYKYDDKLGYEGTLKAVIEQYRKEKIPVGYLQLDSWWYDKTYPGINPQDRVGKWDTRTRGKNTRGGILQFKADASLFPQGLKAFQRSIGLPIMTHSRWISVQSPYRQKYKISGVAPIDTRLWNLITGYLQSSGVINYEQDWQSFIQQHSPAFKNTIGTGAEFYNKMAAACQRHGLTMQYCMALPCDFLQGSRYGNLASIRVSDDHFLRSRWRDFLYTSQLGYAIGSWPWTDVYMSTETDNLLIGDLSAGPVGTGDALGKEDRENLMKVVRADGVIVKPDVPIMPLDRMYIADAGGSSSPFISSTWTEDGPVRTAYVFAFSRSANAGGTVSFSPADVGIHGPAYVFDYFAHKAHPVARGGSFTAQLGPDGVGYYIVAPVAPSGMAFFGDSSKFVSMGKERIASLAEGKRSVKAEVLFAANGGPVTLFGESPSKPEVTVHGGHADAIRYAKSDGYFSVQVAPQRNAPAIKLDGNLVRRVAVTFAP